MAAMPERPSIETIADVGRSLCRRHGAASCADDVAAYLCVVDGHYPMDRVAFELGLGDRVDMLRRINRVSIALRRGLDYALAKIIVRAREDLCQNYFESRTASPSVAMT
jgi:hypothetical protein